MGVKELNGYIVKCKQCKYYRVDETSKEQWWDGLCTNKAHCKTHKAKCPSKVMGFTSACFDAELPDLDQIEMEVNQ